MSHLQILPRAPSKPVTHKITNARHESRYSSECFFYQSLCIWKAYTDNHYSFDNEYEKIGTASETRRMWRPSLRTHRHALSKSAGRHVVLTYEAPVASPDMQDLSRRAGSPEPWPRNFTSRPLVQNANVHARAGKKNKRHHSRTRRNLENFLPGVIKKGF